jgi:hypothetical protein
MASTIYHWDVSVIGSDGQLGDTRRVTDLERGLITAGERASELGLVAVQSYVTRKGHRSTFDGGAWIFDAGHPFDRHDPATRHDVDQYLAILSKRQSILEYFRVMHRAILKVEDISRLYPNLTAIPIRPH